MHDPETEVFNINYPWKNKRGYRSTFASIWHVDPATDGTDDSCGLLLRTRHLDENVLDKIIQFYSIEWDSTFKYCEKEYEVGLFKKTGERRFSTIGITLNLFRMAAYEIFKAKGYLNPHKKGTEYIKNHLYEIILFSENTIDSLYDTISSVYDVKFQSNFNYNETYTVQTKASRLEKIRNLASIIYPYIEGDIRPWYKHPRWHIHHWRIKILPWRRLKRWFRKDNNDGSRESIEKSCD